MDKNLSFQDFMESFKSTENFNIPPQGFLLNLIVAAFLAYLLGKMYVRYGRSMSNRKAFAANFIMLTVTTMIIITIVKSSLALSLGLVGALSIVRYRTAIKEPEELSYLFFSISIGLGLGASQFVTTVIAFVAVSLFIFLKSLNSKANEVYTTLIVTDISGKLKFEACNQVLQETCRNIELKRMDSKQDFIELVYRIEIQDTNLLNSMIEKLKNIHEGISIQFLEA